MNPPPTTTTTPPPPPPSSSAAVLESAAVPPRRLQAASHSFLRNFLIAQIAENQLRVPSSRSLWGQLPPPPPPPSSSSPPPSSDTPSSLLPSLHSAKTTSENLVNPSSRTDGNTTGSVPASQPMTATSTVVSGVTTNGNLEHPTSPSRVSSPQEGKVESTGEDSDPSLEDPEAKAGNQKEMPTTIKETTMTTETTTKRETTTKKELNPEANSFVLKHGRPSRSQIPVPPPVQEIIYNQDGVAFDPRTNLPVDCQPWIQEHAEKYRREKAAKLKQADRPQQPKGSHPSQSQRLETLRKKLTRGGRKFTNRVSHQIPAERTDGRPSILWESRKDTPNIDYWIGLSMLPPLPAPTPQPTSRDPFFRNVMAGLRILDDDDSETAAG